MSLKKSTDSKLCIPLKSVFIFYDDKSNDYMVRIDGRKEILSGKSLKKHDNCSFLKSLFSKFKGDEAEECIEKFYDGLNLILVFHVKFQELPQDVYMRAEW